MMIFRTMKSVAGPKLADPLEYVVLVVVVLVLVVDVVVVVVVVVVDVVVVVVVVVGSMSSTMFDTPDQLSLWSLVFRAKK